MKDWKQKAIGHLDREHLSKQVNTQAGMWPNKTGQIVRFNALKDIGDLNKTTVLDVGCGLGDFYFFLKEVGVELVDYTGIELHPEIVKIAKEKYPDLNIIEGDILENSFHDNSFDYVFSSGLFNFALEDWKERTSTILAELFRLSKYGLSINFLRWRESDRNPVSAYTKLEDLNSLISELTNNFVIRADYKKNDYTVYLYKDQLE